MRDPNHSVHSFLRGTILKPPVMLSAIREALVPLPLSVRGHLWIEGDGGHWLA